MKEILKGQLNEYEYNDFTKETKVIKTYHIYLDEFNRIVIYEPIPVKTLNRLRKILKYNNYNPTNILIGNELIQKGGLD